MLRLRNSSQAVVQSYHALCCTKEPRSRDGALRPFEHLELGRDIQLLVSRATGAQQPLQRMLTRCSAAPCLPMQVVEEIRLLASLSHPTIISYFEAFCDRDKLCVVTEIVQGGDLGTFIRRVLEMFFRTVCGSSGWDQDHRGCAGRGPGLLHWASAGMFCTSWGDLRGVYVQCVARLWLTLCLNVPQ